MAQSERLSPPQVNKPVYECAEVVFVSGFTAGATVNVFANGNELVGSAIPYVGWWHIQMNRPLKAGDVLTAVQEIGGDESFPSRESVTVERLPGLMIDPLAIPKITEPIYHCQQVVEANSILPGAMVEVAEHPDNVSPILGKGNTPTNVARVGTKRLNAGQRLFARQVVCNSMKSNFTHPVPVNFLHSKLATPWIPKDSLVVGSSVIPVMGLVTGAEVNVFVGEQRIAGGIATSSFTIFPTAETIRPNVKYWAEQALCELKSEPPADGGTEAINTLPDPRLLTPICPGANSVIVENTVLGALVKVYVRGRQFGQVTAMRRETLVPLGDDYFFTTDDPVIATQEIGPTGPVRSPTERVSQAGEKVKPLILGGHPFFTAAPGEQEIPGPVFLRGCPTPAGPGPVFRIIACGAKELIDLTVVKPENGGKFTIKLIEGPSGHFTGVWDWSSSSGTPSDSIPVGEYIAQFTVASPGGTWTEKCSFFVIFDPNDVSAPQRFTFDHTGVWFGTGYGSLFAKSYALHLSDYRIFGWAMNVIGGQTNQWDAAKLLAQAEHQRFNWDLHNHGNDVLHLITHETMTQCADDANMLTALLRASGIPAHPVTADARDEFSEASWPFDTWVEVLLKGPDGERWYALHSHQRGSSPKGPVIRILAGNSWGESSRTENDMIIMAGASWDVSDLEKSVVNYNWNTPCKRPSKDVNSKPWIENLTDDRSDRYWPKSFWECSPRYTTPIEIHLEPGNYKAEDILSGQVKINNNTGQSLSGEMSLLLAESRIDTKALADSSSEILIRRIEVAPQEEISLPFQVQLPSSVCADDNVMVVAYFTDFRAIAHVDVSPSFDVKPVAPQSVKVGEAFLLQITVTNLLDRPLIGAIIEIELPMGCVVERPWSTRAREDAGFDIQSVPPVEPDDKSEVNWLLRAVSPLTPALIQIKATAPDFGERRIWVSTFIEDTRLKDYSDPLVPPTYTFPSI